MERNNEEKSQILTVWHYIVCTKDVCRKRGRGFVQTLSVMVFITLTKDFIYRS